MEDSTPFSTVYALCDSEGNIRYIGITKKPIAIRLKEHILRAARGGESYRDNWIRSMDAYPREVSIGRKPSEETRAKMRESHRKRLESRKATDGNRD